MPAIIIALVFCLSLFLSSVPAHSVVFNISSGDVTGLIAAVNAANATDEEDTINLEAGIYTFTAPTIFLPFGLPSDALGLQNVTINGEDGENTVIERDPSAPLPFRILSTRGNVTLNRLTIRGGRLSVLGFGGGILNGGVLTVNRSVIIDNHAGGAGGGIENAGTLNLIDTIVTHGGALVGGGIYNVRGATISILRGTITDNGADTGGGIVNDGLMTIQNSTISDNVTIQSASGVSNEGELTITNTTIARNISNGRAVILNVRNGILKIINSTISDNTGRGVGGIANGIFSDRVEPGTLVELQNTIVALNRNHLSLPPMSWDCSGPITSLGNNIIGDLSNCGINLLASDLTGDPGLGAFIDDGAPGHGRFPLLPGSPAIDAGNDAACSATDQLDTPRLGACDIGAIEFYPVVNDLVAVGNVSTDFDATPVPGGPAGTFRIMADFTNTSNQVIVYPVAEVVELTGGNILLNADGGAGGIGARLRPTETIFQPGASSTFEFLIGLRNREPFTFLVNMLGESLIKPSIRTVTVEAVIDGRSQLILRGNTAQWRHFDFAAPGRLDFKNAPTVINNVEWFPVWPDQPDRENRDCDGCLSDVFTGVNPPLFSENMIVSLRKIQARDNVSIVQLPTPANNFTSVIEFDDNPPSGDDIYVVGIDFVIDRQNGTEAVVARQR